MSSVEEACEACLRRAGLLLALSPMIERVAMRPPRRGARELLALDDAELLEAVAPGGSPGAGRALERAPGAAVLRDRARRVGVWSTCGHGSGFPARLSDLDAEAPAALFGRGDPMLLGALDREPAVAVVGARRASAYGRGVAKDLGRQLARAGVSVISGLANGVDAAAHEGAIVGGAPAVAVLGSGADRAYPRRQLRLYRRIASSGLVLSELPPGGQPFRWTFPARNRIMAALASLTVVVEAADRSGSLITAEMAMDLGRDVGAVPGPVNVSGHAGANRLLADGARVIRGAQDVLDVLFGPGMRNATEQGAELSRGARAILDAIESGSDPDAIAATLSVSPSEVAGQLAQLELAGYLAGDPAGRYRRTSLEPASR